MNSLNWDSRKTLKKESTDQREKFEAKMKIDKELNEERKKKIKKLIGKYENVCMYGNKKLKTTNIE